MPQEYTERGFAVYALFEHKDYANDPNETSQMFSVQMSSLATERKVWIGSDNERAHLSESEALIVRNALTEFLLDGEREYAEIADPGIIPNIPGDPREAQRRNMAALRYMHGCGFMRIEPSKHKIESILLGGEIVEEEPA